MKIENNAVVRFHYTVAEAGDAEVENSRIGDPVAILIGHKNIIPGVENALIGHEAGDRFEVMVSPEEGYGLHREGMTQRLSKKMFPKNATLKPGAQIVLKTDHGQRMVTVQKVGMTVVDVDLNHPLAGKTLNFDIEVVDVREGNAEEIAHGHVHGDGGHAH
ncbi:MAG TPA: peptidylprolyl isomerase [Xanthomonadaceae bacterium]|nr:peptidylprolyl isomerase [Xanthomonadaceae bacterium]